MGIWNRKCAVEGCDDKDSPRHRFPMPNKYLETFQKWLEAAGNTSINGLNPHLIYRSCRICDRHFTPESKGANKYLKENAVPTLFCNVLKNKDIENEENNQVAHNIADRNVLNDSSAAIDHTYALNPLICDDPLTSVISDHTYALSYVLTHGPSTSVTDPGSSLLKHQNAIEPTVLSTDEHMETINMEIDVNIPSTSQQNKNTSENYASTREPETPKTSKRKRKYSFNVLRETGVRKLCDLSPRERVMYKKASLLNRSLQTYKRRMVVFKAKHKPLTEEEQLDALTADLDRHPS